MLDYGRIAGMEEIVAFIIAILGNVRGDNALIGTVFIIVYPNQFFPFAVNLLEGVKVSGHRIGTLVAVGNTNKEVRLDLLHECHFRIDSFLRQRLNYHTSQLLTHGFLGLFMGNGHGQRHRNSILSGKRTVHIGPVGVDLHGIVAGRYRQSILGSVNAQLSGRQKQNVSRHMGGVNGLLGLGIQKSFQRIRIQSLLHFLFQNGTSAQNRHLNGLLNGDGGFIQRGLIKDNFRCQSHFGVGFLRINRTRTIINGQVTGYNLNHLTVRSPVNGRPAIALQINRQRKIGANLCRIRIFSLDGIKGQSLSNLFHVLPDPVCIPGDGGHCRNGNRGIVVGQKEFHVPYRGPVHGCGSRVLIEIGNRSILCNVCIRVGSVGIDADVGNAYLNLVCRKGQALFLNGLCRIVTEAGSDIGVGAKDRLQLYRTHGLRQLFQSLLVKLLLRQHRDFKASGIGRFALGKGSRQGHYGGLTLRQLHHAFLADDFRMAAAPCNRRAIFARLCQVQCHRLIYRGGAYGESGLICCHCLFVLRCLRGLAALPGKNRVAMIERAAFVHTEGLAQGTYHFLRFQFGLGLGGRLACAIANAAGVDGAGIVTVIVAVFQIVGVEHLSHTVSVFVVDGAHHCTAEGIHTVAGALNLACIVAGVYQCILGVGNAHQTCGTAGAGNLTHVVAIPYCRLLHFAHNAADCAIVVLGGRYGAKVCTIGNVAVGISHNTAQINFIVGLVAVSAVAGSNLAIVGTIGNRTGVIHQTDDTAYPLSAGTYIGPVDAAFKGTIGGRAYAAHIGEAGNGAGHGHIPNETALGTISKQSGIQSINGLSVAVKGTCILIIILTNRLPMVFGVFIVEVNIRQQNGIDLGIAAIHGLGKPSQFRSRGNLIHSILQGRLGSGAVPGGTYRHRYGNRQGLSLYLEGTFSIKIAVGYNAVGIRSIRQRQFGGFAYQKFAAVYENRGICGGFCCIGDVQGYFMLGGLFQLNGRNLHRAIVHAEGPGLGHITELFHPVAIFALVQPIALCIRGHDLAFCVGHGNDGILRLYLEGHRESLLGQGNGYGLTALFHGKASGSGIILILRDGIGVSAGFQNPDPRLTAGKLFLILGVFHRNLGVGRFCEKYSNQPNILTFPSQNRASLFRRDTKGAAQKTGQLPRGHILLRHCSGLIFAVFAVSNALFTGIFQIIATNNGLFAALAAHQSTHCAQTGVGDKARVIASGQRSAVVTVQPANHAAYTQIGLALVGCTGNRTLVVAIGDGLVGKANYTAYGVLTGSHCACVIAACNRDAAAAHNATNALFTGDGSGIAAPGHFCAVTGIAYHAANIAVVGTGNAAMIGAVLNHGLFLAIGHVAYHTACKEVFPLYIRGNFHIAHTVFHPSGCNGHHTACVLTAMDTAPNGKIPNDTAGAGIAKQTGTRFRSGNGQTGNGMSFSVKGTIIAVVCTGVHTASSAAHGANGLPGMTAQIDVIGQHCIFLAGLAALNGFVDQIPEPGQLFGGANLIHTICLFRLCGRGSVPCFGGLQGHRNLFVCSVYLNRSRDLSIALGLNGIGIFSIGQGIGAIVLRRKFRSFPVGQDNGCLGLLRCNHKPKGIGRCRSQGFCNFQSGSLDRKGRIRNGCIAKQMGTVGIVSICQKIAAVLLRFLQHFLCILHLNSGSLWHIREGHSPNCRPYGIQVHRLRERNVCPVCIDNRAIRCLCPARKPIAGSYKGIRL